MALFFSALIASGCGGLERSTEAFCDTLASEKERILNQFESQVDRSGVDSLGDVVAGLGASAQALGELRTYFNKLSEVAPDEIRAETEIIADAYDEQLDKAGDAVSDPVGGLASGLFSSLTVSGQMKTVGQFARDNCGESL